MNLACGACGDDLGIGLDNQVQIGTLNINRGVRVGRVGLEIDNITDQGGTGYCCDAGGVGEFVAFVD